MNEKEIYDEIMQVCEKYMGMTGAEVKPYWALPYPQRLFNLNELLKWHLLREGGDIKRFLYVSKSMEVIEGRQPSNANNKLVAMMTWLDKQIDAIELFKTDSPKEKLVISLMCYGQEFVERMENGLFKSWLSEGNMPALLKDKCVIINIHTTELWRTTIEQAIKPLGVNVVFNIIPEMLISNLGVDIYWLVGASATLGITYAKRNGAAYHHACPDHIYSDKYFSELLKLSKKHRNIVQSSMRTDEMLMRKLLKPYEKNGIIAIPSEDLVSLSLNAVHVSEWNSMMLNRPQQNAVPLTHKMYWESQDVLYIQSPHVNPAWLCIDTLKNIPDRFYHSIDSELDMIAKADDFYMPQFSDKLYLSELSNQSAFPIDDRFLENSQYGAIFWQVASIRDLLKFFYPGMAVALNRSLRVETPVFPERQVKQEQQMLYNIILSADPYRGKKLARPRLHDVMNAA